MKGDAEHGEHDFHAFEHDVGLGKGWRDRNLLSLFAFGDVSSDFGCGRVGFSPAASARKHTKPGGAEQVVELPFVGYPACFGEFVEKLFHAL